MHRWFLALLVLSCTAHVQAAPWTVRADQSIAAALSQMQAGDTLTIEEGTYDEQELHPPSGVTVQGADGHNVIIRPTGAPTIVFEFGSTHVTIRNLTIDGIAGGVTYGIYITGTDNTIDNVTVAYPRYQGIVLFCSGPDNHQHCGHGGNVLSNVHAYGAGMGPDGCQAHGLESPNEPGLCHGGYTYTDDNIIVGGEFDHNNGFGIQIYGFHNDIQDAYLHDNVGGAITVIGSAHIENSGL